MAVFRKKLFLFFLILIIAASLGIIYLNNVFLPTRARYFIIGELRQATGKDVTIGALKLNILRGFVIQDLAVFDAQKRFLDVKEIRLSFLLLPIFSRRIVVPSATFIEPVFSIERRQGGEWNFSELLSRAKGARQKRRFTAFFSRMRLVDAVVNLSDSAVEPPLQKQIKDIDLLARMSLSGKINFFLRQAVLADSPTVIQAKGSYSFVAREFSSQCSVAGLSVGEFLRYLPWPGAFEAGGLIDGEAQIGVKKGIVDAVIKSKVRKLDFKKDNLSGRVNADITSQLSYNMGSRRVRAKGQAALWKSNIDGLDRIDSITDIDGQIYFDGQKITSDNLRAVIWELPLKAHLALEDLEQPSLRIDMVAPLDLIQARKLAKEKFDFTLPALISGRAVLKLSLFWQSLSEKLSGVSGRLEVAEAAITPDKPAYMLENVSGAFDFDSDQLKWQDLAFQFQGVSYTSSGELANFKNPGLKLSLNSADLSLRALLAIQGNAVRISECLGSFLRSNFSFQGTVSTASLPDLPAELEVSIDVQLADLQKILKNSAKEIEDMRPDGVASVQASIKGDVTHLNSCLIEGRIQSEEFSLYGLKAQEGAVVFSQRDGIIDMPAAHMLFYGGAIDGSASCNLNSPSYPYWLDVRLEGVKIEKVKLDTEASKEDIAGTVNSEIKLNGFGDNLDRLSGAGKITIKDGNLWQLNLFKGLGLILFDKNYFNKILFREGYCGFSVQDKNIFSDNLVLKSDVAEMTGKVKIGFDSSVDASLDVHVIDELVPLTGTFKDVTTAIVGQAGRFGVIKITGTLKEPKYKFRPAIVDIFKGFKDVFMGNKNQ